MSQSYYPLVGHIIDLRESDDWNFPGGKFQIVSKDLAYDTYDILPYPLPDVNFMTYTVTEEFLLKHRIDPEVPSGLGPFKLLCDPPTECAHQWKPYVGLTERYEYCEVCDEKRK
jgi:hypothetical protein